MKQRGIVRLFSNEYHFPKGIEYFIFGKFVITLAI